LLVIERLSFDLKAVDARLAECGQCGRVSMGATVTHIRGIVTGHGLLQYKTGNLVYPYDATKLNRAWCMIIDWHAHIYTPDEAADDKGAWDGKDGPRWGERGCPMVLENFLDAHHKAGIDISVFSNAAHYLRGKRADEELAAVQKWHDYAARVQQDHEGVLYGFATILPCGGPMLVKETERAIRELGLKGIFIHSSHKGSYPDDDEARPFWELAQDLDVPVMIHPPNAGFGEERMRDYRLASSIGRPFDLCLALGRLIVRGVFEDFPKLKLVASHGGGGIC